MPRVEFSTVLRSATQGRAEVTVEGTTVAQVLEAACLVYPELRPRLFAEGGTFKRSVGIFVGEDDVRTKQGLQKALSSSDVVVLMAAMAGG